MIATNLVAYTWTVAFSRRYDALNWNDILKEICLEKYVTYFKRKKKKK